MNGPWAGRSARDQGHQVHTSQCLESLQFARWTPTREIETAMRSFLATGAMVLMLTAVAASQEKHSSFAQEFFAHNAKMTRLQPAMVTPIATADPRLIQYARFSVSHEYTSSGAETVSYGNARGGGIVVGDRFEFDWLPPAYIQHNSNFVKDGASDTSLVGKLRLASGNAEHGNFDVAFLLARCFATGSHKNGSLTGSFTPTLVGVKTLGKFDIISAIAGTLPTAKIQAQGRTINWNTLTQFHATRHVWFEVENNATFYFAGSHDGKMQNFITPGAFYVARSSEWASTHPFFIFDAGMQMATSGFHVYNHNLIAETRLIF